MSFRIAHSCRLFVFLAVLPGLPLTASGADSSTPPTKSSAAKYTLHYKFQPGEIVRMQVWDRASTEATIAGTTQTEENAAGSVMQWKIKDVDQQGHITFEHSVESVNMRQKVSGRQEVIYNSQTDKQPPPRYADISKLIGIPLTDVIIEPSGKILKRTDKRPGASANPQNRQMVMPLPAGAVAIGDSWNESSDLTVPTENGETKIIKTRLHYTLDKVTDGIATISVVTQVLTPVANPQVQVQFAQQMKQGTVRFDIDAGRVLSEQLDTDERVLGFQGGDSSVHFVGRFTEDYLPPQTKTAARPKAPK